MTYLLQIQFQNKSIEDNFEQLWNIFIIVIAFDLSNFEIFKSHKEVQPESISEVFTNGKSHKIK